MSSKHSCRIHHLVDKIVNKKSEKFASKNTLQKLKEPVLEVKNKKVSFADLRSQMIKDYPKIKDTLISVPASSLLKYPKKVPFHVTEADGRKHLEDMLDKSLRSKKEALRSSKTIEIVEDAFSRFKEGSILISDASDKLNDTILEIIFVEEKCTKPCCKESKNVNDEEICCSAKEAKFERLKATYRKWMWPRILNTASDSEDILSFAETELEKNCKKYLHKTPEFDFLSKIRGQKSENELLSKIHSHLNVSDQPGLLISGYKVFSSLKPLLKNYEIKLRGCANDNNQVEHDIISVFPVNDKVRVNFVQAKATIKLPGGNEGEKEKNIVSACEKAFSQIFRDLETIVQLMEHFLTLEEFEKIEFTFAVSMTSLDGIPEEAICLDCRHYILEENKEIDACTEKQIFGIDDLTPPSDSTFEIFLTLATLYIGGASIVELKTPNEGYTKESKRMNLVQESMKEVLERDSEEKDLTIQLGPDQNSIFMSRAESYAVIAPWGGGKSMLLELELHRAVELYNLTKEQVDMYVVVYETKATKLLKHYQNLVDDFALKKNIRIEVMNLKGMCKMVDMQHESRNSTVVINELCKKLFEQSAGKKSCLFMDEVIISNPDITSPKDLLGKVPFVLDGEVFPWSDLDSHGVSLMVCINPECQDLVQLQNLDVADILELKQLKPEQGTVPTIAMHRAYRNSNAINGFLQEVKRKCASAHKEFGYLIPSTEVRVGHEIQGLLPCWIEAPRQQHIKCAKSKCDNCFLFYIKDELDFLLHQLKGEGIHNDDILVIASSSESTKNSLGSYETDFLRRTHPALRITSNFDFDGCEARVVIVIRNGGLLSFSLSSAVSRASSRLFLFMPDDHNILDDCCKNGLLIRKKELLSENPALREEKPNNWDGLYSKPTAELKTEMIEKSFTNEIKAAHSHSNESDGPKKTIRKNQKYSKLVRKLKKQIESLKQDKEDQKSRAEYWETRFHEKTIA